MRYLNDGKQAIIFGSALLGAAYGCLATITSPVAGVTAFGVALTIVVGAALFACVASALLRCYQVWQAIRRGQFELVHPADPHTDVTSSHTRHGNRELPLSQLFHDCTL